MQYTKNNLFNTPKKRFAALTVATSTMMTGLIVYVAHVSDTYIDCAIERYLNNDTPTNYLKAYETVENNKKLSLKYIINNFEKIIQKKYGANIIELVLTLHPDTIDVLTQEAVKVGSQLVETIDGQHIFFHLILTKLIMSDEIDVDMEKLAINNIGKLSRSLFGINSLIFLIERNSSTFVEAIKKNIDLLIRQRDCCFILKPILKNNPETIDWLSNYALNNFEVVYSNNIRVFSDIISVCNDTDALKFKKLIDEKAGVDDHDLQIRKALEIRINQLKK